METTRQRLMGMVTRIRSMGITITTSRIKGVPIRIIRETKMRRWKHRIKKKSKKKLARINRRVIMKVENKVMLLIMKIRTNNKIKHLKITNSSSNSNNITNPEVSSMDFRDR